MSYTDHFRTLKSYQCIGHCSPFQTLGLSDFDHMICKKAEPLKVGMFREDTKRNFCSVLRMNHSDSQLRNEEQYNSYIKE